MWRPESERFSLVLLIAGAAALVLPGCATIYEGRLNYGEGWRVARIAEIGLGGALANDGSTQCRTEVPSRGRADSTFAVVRYLEYRDVSAPGRIARVLKIESFRRRDVDSPENVALVLEVRQALHLHASGTVQLEALSA